MLEPGDVVAEKYQIKALIGRGGMGEVYLVRHALTERRFALKVLAPALVGTQAASQRLVREALAAGRIEHRNVVDVFDVGEHRGGVYLVMEYLEGRPMSELLDAGELSDRALLALMLRAMEGVAAAHDQGIIHRDLKPENVYVCVSSDGTPDEPRVMDFGISRLPERLGGSADSTGSFVVGTPHFMCVEQLEGARDLDARVDVYALGVSLYRAFSGHVPFAGAHFAELSARIAQATPVPLAELRPDLPRLLCETVMRAMARRREDRHPSVRVLGRDLETFLSGLSDAPARLRRPRPITQAMPVVQPAVLAAPSHPPERAASRISPWWYVGLSAPLTVLLVWWLARPRAEQTEVQVVRSADVAQQPAPAARASDLPAAVIDDPIAPLAPRAVRRSRRGESRSRPGFARAPEGALRPRAEPPPEAPVAAAPAMPEPATAPEPQPGYDLLHELKDGRALPRQLDEEDPYAR